MASSGKYSGRAVQVGLQRQGGSNEAALAKRNAQRGDAEGVGKHEHGPTILEYLEYENWTIPSVNMSSTN